MDSILCTVHYRDIKKKKEKGLSHKDFVQADDLSILFRHTPLLTSRKMHWVSPVDMSVGSSGHQAEFLQRTRDSRKSHWSYKNDD